MSYAHTVASLVFEARTVHVLCTFECRKPKPNAAAFASLAETLTPQVSQRLRGRMVTSDPEHGDEGLAFALTIGAGAASVIGGAVVFHKKWVKLASHRVLAMSLAASAGVMLYVSFVELMAEAVVEFEIHNPEPGRAVTIATLCFFLGMLFTAGLGRLVHILDDHHSHDAGKELGELGGHVDGPALSAGAMDDLANVVTPPDTCSHCDNASQAGRHHVEPGGLLSPGSQQQQPSGDGNMDVAGFTPDTPAVPATAQPDDAGGVSAAMEDGASHPAPVTAVDAAPQGHGGEASEHAGHPAGVSPAVGTDDADAAAGVIVSVPDTPVPADEEDQAKQTVPEHERKKLRNMGLLTALAIGIHNLPEGTRRVTGGCLCRHGP